jgi:hypothetical protein
MSKVKPNYYKWEIEETLKGYFFEAASLSNTKAMILEQVKIQMQELELRGERIFALLYFTLASTGLRKMQGWDTKDYMDVIKEVKLRWDTEPEYRNRHALAEAL